MKCVEDFKTSFFVLYQSYTHDFGILKSLLVSSLDVTE